MRAYRQQNLRLRVESSRLNQIYPTIPLLVRLMLYPLLWTGTVLFVATPPYLEIGPDDEGILLGTKYLHPGQKNLGNEMCDMRLLEV